MKIQSKDAIKKLLIKRVKILKQMKKENEMFLQDDLLDIYYMSEIKEYENLLKEFEKEEIEII